MSDFPLLLLFTHVISNTAPEVPQADSCCVGGVEAKEKFAALTYWILLDGPLTIPCFRWVSLLT